MSDRNRPQSKPAEVSHPLSDVQPGESLSLDDIASKLGPADRKLTAAIIARCDDEVRLRAGTTMASHEIVRDVPAFVTSVLDIRASLANQGRTVRGDDPRLLPILVEQTQKLRGLMTEHGETVTAGSGATHTRRAKARMTSGDGVLLRDEAYDAARNVIGTNPAKVAELDKACGTAATPEELKRGLRSLAGFIGRLVADKDEDTVQLCRAFGVNSGLVRELEAKADEVGEAAEGKVAGHDPRVSQRVLDLQDGLVIHLVDMVYRTFRAAHDRDAAVVLPKLGAFKKGLRIRRARSEATTPAAPARVVTDANE